MYKKLKLLPLCLLILNISCNENQNSESQENNGESTIETIPTCECSEITLGEDHLSYYDGKIYTGICIKKDKYDTIVEQFEFNNGYERSRMKKTRLKDKSYVINQLIDKDGNGYWATHNDWSDVIPYVVLSSYSLKKENITDYEYDLSFEHPLTELDYDEALKHVRLSLKISFNNGNQISFNTREDIMNSKYFPFCFKDSEYDKYSKRFIIIFSKDNLDYILDCLKQHLPNFEYWKK